jgi:hypothetical protein
VDDFGNIRLSGANGEDIFMSPTFSFLSAKFPYRLCQLYKMKTFFLSHIFRLPVLVT